MMRALKNLNFGTKLSLGFGVVLSLMIALSVVVHRNIKHLVDSAHWVEHTQEVIQVAEEVQAAMLDMETGERGFLITGKEEYLEPYHAGIENISELIDRGQELTRENPAQVKRWRQVLKLKEQWIDSAAKPEIDARRNMTKNSLTIEDIAQMMINGQGKKLMDQTRQQLDALIGTEKQLIVTRTDEQTRTKDFTIDSTIFGTLFAVVIGIIAWLLVTRSVVNPLVKTNITLEKISAGDLTQRIPVDAEDELGQMGRNFNRFADKLQDMIKQIADATSQLNIASEGLVTITGQTTTGVNNQKIATEQVATAINEMSATVQEVATNASEASNSASEADSEAKSGSRVVTNTVAEIERLSDEIEESTRVIEKLRVNSTNIGSVLDVIKNIAEQTNLLALNAAIEAARAGEQGRGFAVVADEVRGLAQRTQESTSEIEALIQSLQQGAEESVSVMEQNRKSARDTVEQARTAGTSLATITSAVENIVAMNTSIATATEEQSSVAEEINRSVTHIQQIAEETALGARQIADSSNGLNNLGSQLQQVVNQFRV